MDQNNNHREHPFIKQPIAEIPEVDSGFYIDEFLRWLSEDFNRTLATDKIDTDYSTEHKDWPRLIDSVPKTTLWEPLIKQDLSIAPRTTMNMEERNISITHWSFLIQTLSAIKQNFELFISQYASFVQLTKLLTSSKNNIYEGEIILIKQLSDTLLSRKNDETKQLIPRLYHYRDHGYLMSVNLENVDKMDIKTGELVFEYGFSKTSSDNFTNELDKILSNRIIKLENLLRPDISDLGTSTSYQWKDIQHFNRVTELGNLLKKKGFIDSETRMTDFKSVFNGEIKHPVNWIGDSTLSEILYLMFLLWENEQYRWIIKPRQPYKNLCNCFLNNGKRFSYKHLVTDGNAKTIYSRIKSGVERPAMAKIIKNILEQISKK